MSSAATRVLMVECPGWPEDDARGFEAVVVAVESFTPIVEVVRPGVCAFATRGPSRYFGRDEALAAKVAEKVDGVLAGLGKGGCRVGVADGRFAAELAARTLTRVPAGSSAAFLASFPVTVLPEPDLPDLLRRLGVHTLGELAALPAAAVLARFGTAGREAHRLARGLEDAPLVARARAALQSGRHSLPPADLTVATELDPPVVAVETAAFAGKSLAHQLGDLLAGQGMIATCVRVEAETEHGELLTRLWRHDRGLTAAALAQRVRWQLDGWEGAVLLPGAGGIVLLRLVPVEVCPDHGRQLSFWGERAGGDRASRALARVQGMLGHEAVVTGVLQGAREPGGQVRRVPWSDPLPPPGVLKARREREPPWPGSIPAPSPATVHSRPVAADVVDPSGTRVTVTGRGQASAEPARLSIAGGPWAGIEAWAGPWPLDERWWDAAARRRRARWQLVTGNGSAHLLIVEGGRWWVEATYD